MHMKYVLLIYLLFMLVSSASADYTIGVDGDEIWSGNATIGANASIRQSTGYVVAMQEMNDSWDEWWFDALEGTTLLNENRTSAHDLTLNSSLWNSDGYELDGLAGNAIDTGFQYSPASALTIGIKFNVTGPDDSYRGYLLTERGAWLQFRDNPTNWRDFQINNGSSYQAINYDEPTFNTTQSWFATYDGDLFSLYDVDTGLLASNNALTPTRTGAANFIIGGPGYYHIGYIYALKMWKNESKSTSDYAKIFDYRTAGDINITFSNDAGAGNQGSTYVVNFTGTGTVKGYSSSDGSTWSQDSADITTNTPVSITTKNQTQHIRLVLISSTSNSPNIINATIFSESAVSSYDLNVTYWNPGSGGLVATYNITNISAGVDTINILLNVTRDTWKYTLTYSNDTEISNQTATSTNESLNFSIPLVEDSYNITESSSGAADTKFEYWAPGWTENPADYHFWFNCFWNTSGYPNGVAPNAEQTGSQHSLKITNNGSAAGTANIKFNESSPAEVTVYIDDDYTVAGAMVITNSYQEIGPVLQPGENVTLSTWVKLEGLTSVWEFTAQVEVQ